MIYAGILAGGIGSRMGITDKPKQFLSVCGKPIIVRTIESFLACERFDHIYIAVVKDFIPLLSDIIEKTFGSTDRITVVEGGKDRNGSIVNVISEIRRLDSSPESILVTHDAVRPFVSRRVIDANIDAAIKFGATDTVVPATDTIVRSADGTVLDDIPLRDELYNSQTPQAFKIGMFEEDFLTLRDEQKRTLTDACKIFLLAGRTVYMVRGDTYNIKITTPFDLVIAEAIVKQYNFT